MHVAFFLYSFISLSPQNLQWARDVLLGSGVPWQQLKHMPAQGLFCERNKTNLFNVSQSLLLMFFMHPHPTVKLDVEKVGFYWESSNVASPILLPLMMITQGFLYIFSLKCSKSRINSVCVYIYLSLSLYI